MSLSKLDFIACLANLSKRTKNRQIFQFEINIWLESFKGQIQPKSLTNGALVVHCCYPSLFSMQISSRCCSFPWGSPDHKPPTSTTFHGEVTFDLHIFGVKMLMDFTDSSMLLQLFRNPLTFGGRKKLILEDMSLIRSMGFWPKSNLRSVDPMVEISTSHGFFPTKLWKKMVEASEIFCWSTFFSGSENLNIETNCTGIFYECKYMFYIMYSPMVQRFDTG